MSPKTVDTNSVHTRLEEQSELSSQRSVEGVVSAILGGDRRHT